MKKQIIIFSLLLLGHDAFSQIRPEKITSRVHYEKSACYFYHDNKEFAVSYEVDKLTDDFDHYTHSYVIKSRDNNNMWKACSDVLYDSEINGNSGNMIDIHQAWADNKFQSKQITTPNVNYGGNAQIVVVDSTHIIFTTVLYLKERHNNVPSFYPYPMAFILEYDYDTKYWKRLKYKTYSLRPYETLVIKKINNSKYHIYDSKESCYMVFNEKEPQILDN